MSDQSSSIRNLYFYLVSFIALGFMVGSSVYVVNYFAKTSVFTRADNAFRSIPPPLFFVPVKSTDAPDTTLECADGCTLTEAQRTNINDWQTSYQQWQQQGTPSTNRTQGLVNALSFLLVSLPIFYFHFRTAQRDFHEENAVGADPKRSGRTIRTFYFYLVALAAVVMFIISAGVTVNTGLKTWLIKDTSSNATPVKALPLTSMDTEGVDAAMKCADRCKLSAEQQELLGQWKKDYAAVREETENSNVNNWQRTLATSIPFLLISIPLFWLHWVVIQRERKKVTQ